MIFRGSVFAMLLGLCVMPALAEQAISFNTLPVLQTNAPNSNIPNVANDIDGDGVSDLLWFNPTTSQFGYWLMSVDENGNFTRKGSKIINVTPGYFIGATGDFNGDGMVDLMWTSANRDLYLWTNQGGAFNSTYVGTYPDGWTLLGAADIDGDGQADLLWWNEASSEFGYWLMKNGKQAGARIIPITAGYHVAAVGYFSASNRASILWRGPNSELYIWDSQETGFTSYSLGSLPADAVQSRIDGFSAYASGTYARFCFLTVDTSPVLQYCMNRWYNANGVQTSLGFGQDGGAFFQTGQSIGGTVSSIGLATQIYIYDIIDPTAPNPAMVYIPGTTQPPLANGASFQMAYPMGWYLVGSQSNLAQ